MGNLLLQKCASLQAFHLPLSVISGARSTLVWSVYPGDTLRVESELLEKRRSSSRPEMGLTKTQSTVFNQHNEPVMSMIANGMVRVRNPESS